jgi:hypothetical protein
MRKPFIDTRRPATATRMEAAHDDRAANLCARDDQLVDIELMVVLGIGDRRFQRLTHGLRDAALAEGQRGDRLAGRLVADQTRDQIQLTRADTQIAERALRFVIREQAGMFWLAHLSPVSLSCPTSDP